MVGIRAFSDGDAAALDGLLDVDPDPLWVQQGHRLHGAPRDGDRWRRTWVAEQDESVIGAVTVARNPDHPGRYVCAVEVAPAARRRGLGRALVVHALSVRPEPRPLSAKIREADPAARGLARAVGARVYQRAPVPRLDPAAPEIRAWCDGHRGEVSSLEALDADALAAAFAQMYRWTHQAWSPVGSETGLVEAAHLVAAEADRSLSCGQWDDGQLAAFALIFLAEPGRAECVLETVRRDQQGGITMVAAVLAGVLDAAHQHGLNEVELDGHDSDAHLAAVIATLPIHCAAPVLLVELADTSGVDDSG